MKHFPIVLTRRGAANRVQPDHQPALHCGERLKYSQCSTGQCQNFEIGTGCGYQTAILAQHVDFVYSIERIRPLLEKTRDRFRELKIRNVSLKCGDGNLGWPQHAPFDCIITTAVANEVPQALLEQLNEGGVLVIPVGRPGLPGTETVS